MTQDRPSAARKMCHTSSEPTILLWVRQSRWAKRPVNFTVNGTAWNGMERHYPPCLLCGALSWRSFDLGQPGNMIKPMTFVSKPGMLNAQVKHKSNSLSTLVNSINLFQSLNLSIFFRSCFVHDPNLHPTGCTVVSFLTESIDLVNMGRRVNSCDALRHGDKMWQIPTSNLSIHQTSSNLLTSLTHHTHPHTCDV